MNSPREQLIKNDLEYLRKAIDHLSKACSNMDIYMCMRAMEYLAYEDYLDNRESDARAERIAGASCTSYEEAHFPSSTWKSVVTAPDDMDLLVLTAKEEVLVAWKHTKTGEWKNSDYAIIPQPLFWMELPNSCITNALAESTEQMNG